MTTLLLLLLLLLFKKKNSIAYYIKRYLKKIDGYAAPNSHLGVSLVKLYGFG